MRDDKELRWVGSSYQELLAFPRDARRTAGFELGKMQAGLELSDERARQGHCGGSLSEAW